MTITLDISNTDYGFAVIAPGLGGKVLARRRTVERAQSALKQAQRIARECSGNGMNSRQVAELIESKLRR